MLDNANFNPSENCPHSKKMLALLDTPKDDYRFDSLKDHVQKCNVCKRKYNEASKFVAHLNRGIPFVTLSEEISDSLDNEISSFVDGLIEIEHLKDRNRRLKKLSFLKSICSDFGRALFSISFFKGFLWAMLASLILKYIL